MTTDGDESSMHLFLSFWRVAGSRSTDTLCAIVIVGRGKNKKANN